MLGAISRKLAGKKAHQEGEQGEESDAPASSGGTAPCKARDKFIVGCDKLKKPQDITIDFCRIGMQ